MMMTHLERTAGTPRAATALRAVACAAFGVFAHLAACSADPAAVPGSSGSTDEAGTMPPDADAGPGSQSEASTSTPDSSTGDATASGKDYGQPGPSTVTTARATVTGSASGSFSVDLTIPGGAGPFPVVILSSGGLQAGIAYAPYAKRLASWGILTVTRDDPGLGANVANLASDVAFEVTTWLPAQNAQSGSPLFGKVDVARVGLAGHSRGARISLIAAQNGALGKLKGLFGLDPVDDRAPFGRTDIATMGIPIAFVGETTNSGSSDCAPAASNFQTLYGLAASPAVAITAVNADHTMFQDPAQCTLCLLCSKGSASQAEVLAYSMRYLTAFFARELKGDAAVGAAFQGAGAPADVASGKITIVSK